MSGVQPLRVLHLVHSLDPAGGGVAVGLRQLAPACARGGHRHEIVTLDGPDRPFLGDIEVPVHALGPALGGYGFTRGLAPWLRREADRVDALVVHGLWQYHGYAARRLLRARAIPYAVFCHGMLDPWFRTAHPFKHLKKWLYWPWGEYRVLRDAGAVLFTTEEEALLAPQSFRLYRARPAVVGFGLELDAVAASAGPEAFLQAFPATRGRRRLLFMGRIHPKKGCDLLIAAFARARERDPSLHLVMAGPDQIGWQPALQEQARRLGVEDGLTWCGMLSGALKWSAYRAAEAFVLPSHQENFGLAVAEALALGVPVLISRKVNTWREIDAAGAGWAAADDLPGTTEVLCRWAALDPRSSAEMGERARSCFESNFRVEAVADRLNAVLVGLRDGAAGGRGARRPEAAPHALRAVHMGATKLPQTQALAFPVDPPTSGTPPCACPPHSRPSC